MSRRVIDERDALRRTVARQDAEIRRLQADLRKASVANHDRLDVLKAQWRKEYLEEMAEGMEKVLRKYPIA